jgi:transposase
MGNTLNRAATKHGGLRGSHTVHRPADNRRSAEQCRRLADTAVNEVSGAQIRRGADEAMVAYVLVAKYAWHPPLYRQAQMLLGSWYQAWKLP